MKRWIAFAAALLCLGTTCLLCGCDMKLQEVSEPETTHTALVLLDVDISTLITKAELEEALDNVTLREPQISNEGRTLFAISEGGKVSVSMSVEKRTLDEFHNALPKVSEDDLQEAPNLAQEAWWLSSGSTLFLYSGGYIVSIAVSDRTVDEETRLLSARSIASILCGRLPAA